MNQQIKLLVFTLLLLGTAGQLTAQEHTLSAVRMLDIQRVGSPVISPDGEDGGLHGHPNAHCLEQLHNRCYDTANRWSSCTGADHWQCTGLAARTEPGLDSCGAVSSGKSNPMAAMNDR